MSSMEGIGASPGIAIGRALVLERPPRVARGQLLEDDAAVQREIELYYTAVRRSVAEIREILSREAVSLESEGSGILEVQVELLGDPQMEMDVLRKKIGRAHV